MKNTREPKRRKKQKIKVSIKIGILITVLVLIVVAAGILMFPAFDVTEIYCEGNVNVSSEEILNEANLATGKNIFFEDVGRAERKISKIHMIEDVTVYRVFPDKICISVVERTPAFYIATGDTSVMLDINGVVLKELDAGMTAQLLERNIPRIAVEDEEKENDSKEAPETEDAILQENEEMFLNIPVVAGMELSNAKLGKKAESKDYSKSETVFALCRGLNNAGLLNKATYIDVTDSNNIIFVIENRLEVHFGTTENVEYRAKFLSEVVTTKLSAYERAIMDYTGDDIYVRPPDDGKDKVIKKAEEPEKTEETKEEAPEQTEEPQENPPANISL